MFVLPTLNLGTVGTTFGVVNPYETNSYSALFDSTSDSISVGTVSTLASASTFSMSIWFRLGGTATRLLWSSGSASSQNFDILFLSGKVRVRHNGTSGSTRLLDTTGITFSTDTWYHLVFTKNGATGKIYIDGSLNNTNTGMLTALHANAGNNALIGNLTWTSSVYGFDGYLDEVALFDYELSSTQVSSIYNDKEYDTITSFWRLENDVTDEFGNNDGTNNGVTFSSSVKPY